MYPSFREFAIPSESLSELEPFYKLFCELSKLQNEKNEEKYSGLAELEETSKDLTLMYFLEIARRILVEGFTSDCDIIIITSNINSLIESEDLDIFFEQTPELKDIFASSILYLLPFTAGYYQKTGIIIPFTNLYSSVLELIFIHRPDNVELFNQYINFLLNDANQYQIIIALYFATKFNILDQNKEKVVNLVKFLLEKLPECEFIPEFQIQNQLNSETYHIFFNYLIKNGLMLYQEINFVQGIGQIFKFIDNFIHKEKSIKEEKDLIKKIIEFFNCLLRNIKPYKGLDEDYKTKILNILIQNVYVRAIMIIFKSDFENSYLLSQFFLVASDDFDFTFIISRKPNYFVHTIFCLSIFNELLGSEQHIFTDFYDIDYYYIIYLSNRQNVAQFIYFITTKYDNNLECISAISKFLMSLPEEQIKETHIFILTVLNDIVTLTKSTDKNILQMLYELIKKFIEVGEAVTSNEINSDKKFIYLFTFIRLINSSFYIIDKISEESEKKKIFEFYNNKAICLKKIIDDCTEETQNENYYKIFFTFLCKLFNNLLEYEYLKIDPKEIIPFVNEYFQLCITNDANTVKSNCAIALKDLDLFLESIFIYIEKCIKIVEKLIRIDNEKAEDAESEEDENEEENDINHFIRYFEDNISKISNLIKRANMADLEKSDIFSTDGQNIFVKLAKLLISTRFESINFETWCFKEESIKLFSALFSQVPNLFDWIQKYLKLINKHELCDYGEWSIPIITAISTRPEIIDQKYYDLIIPFLKKSIECILEDSDDGKIIATDYFLMFSSLLTRFFELGITDQLNIPSEDISSFVEFAIMTAPNDKDCEVDGHYKIIGHDLGVNILRLASFLLNHDDLSEIVEFLQMILNDFKIVGQEMRFIIIFLIDNVLKANEDEDFQKLKKFCLSNDSKKDDQYLKAYIENRDNLVNYETHPIFKLYKINDFMFDE